MGTNYYHHVELCPCCHNECVTHIGKSSAGWTFSFHGTATIVSLVQWKEALKVGWIIDEYGEDISVDEFLGLVEIKKNEKHNHARDYPNEYSWLDDEGNSFSSYDFS